MVLLTDIRLALWQRVIMLKKEGIDFEETFAPTSHITTIRRVIALAAYNGWEVHQLAIKTAYPNGILVEEVLCFPTSWF